MNRYLAAVYIGEHAAALPAHLGDPRPVLTDI